MVRKTLKEEQAVKKYKTPITQSDFVLDYLLGSGRKGATNFEMMVNLQMCDVRKRITEINRDEECKYNIYSVWENNENMKHYKRYYAVPYGMSLEEFLSGKKKIASIRGQRGNKKRG